MQSHVVLMLAAPLAVEPGSPMTVVLQANATDSLSELALVAFAAVGVAAIGLRRRRPVTVLLLVLLISLCACAKKPVEAEPVTVSFTTQLTAVDSDATEGTGLPLDGANVSITY